VENAISIRKLEKLSRLKETNCVYVAPGTAESEPERLDRVPDRVVDVEETCA